MEAAIRSPQQVIELVLENMPNAPELAHVIANRLVKALESVPGTIIYAENKQLLWGTLNATVSS